MLVNEITFNTRDELEAYLEHYGCDNATISMFSVALFGDESF